MKRFRLSKLDIECKYGNCSEGVTKLLEITHNTALIKGRICSVGDPISLAFEVSNNKFNRSGTVVWTEKDYSVLHLNKISNDNDKLIDCCNRAQ